ncbi:UAA-domain-containing protein [Sistotremastrum suecicum HHB10207 ss-3]|uniref:UAA-domain-containing protein n=1 Tax=Sistotremastrum suecicum HHB10207 ss-3 TaxID=1314776 RepID=A0A166DW20_9AGAM|nr:UAA-domain-containing protein [Sistotremastrum suecicum HHB10207 ss-3]
MGGRIILLSIGMPSFFEWTATLGLVFGGCCSNALALELVTSRLPQAGKLITFVQFLVISIFGLIRHLTVSPRPLSEEKVMDQVAARILALRKLLPKGHIMRVAVDGRVDSSRRSFADGLYARLKEAAPVVKVALTDFRDPSHPFEDHHESTPDLKAFRRKLLDPLSPSGSQEYITGLSDDHSVPAKAEDGSILLVQGRHLHGEEIRSYWDSSIFFDSLDLITIQRTPSNSSSSDSHLSHSPKKHTRRHSRGGSRSRILVDETYQEPEPLHARHPIVVKESVSGVFIDDLTPPSFLTKLGRLRLMPRSIPIRRWTVQVVLFLLTSLLNNIAFAYRVPMPVHIIFRSGGMVVNMVMGWFIGKRYTKLQITSIIFVTLGVILTTFSASFDDPHISSESVQTAYTEYFIGVGILTLALILSGAMGLAQDAMYSEYGRGHWQEALFYLHFLSMPMFVFMADDIKSQYVSMTANARLFASNFSSPNPNSTKPDFPFLLPMTATPAQLAFLFYYIPLLTNVLTQLVCISGVHRLTSRVDSLTVALILVVRKAVSLGISVLWIRGDGDGGNAWLWPNEVVEGNGVDSKKNQ